MIPRAALTMLAALLLEVLAVGPSLAATPGLLVQPFDLFDTSIDHRPAVIAAQKRWMNDATVEIRRQLDRGGRVHVIAAKAVAQPYAHPSTCRACAIAEARQVGARYVFIGSIHKVSDLIIYMRGELDRVGSGSPLMVKSMEVKADNRTMMLRAADAMAAAIGRHLPEPGQPASNG